MWPVFRMVKCEDVALAVDEATSKSRKFVSPLFAWMATFANGVVVPIPTLPLAFQMPEPAK